MLKISLLNSKEFLYGIKEDVSQLVKHPFFLISMKVGFAYSQATDGISSKIRWSKKILSINFSYSE